MGKKKKIARYPRKFGAKHANHPITRAANPVAVAVEAVVEVVESAVEAVVVEAVTPDPVVEAPAKPVKKKRFLKSKASKG